MIIGHWSLVIPAEAGGRGRCSLSHWSLAIGHWPLAIGYWLLVVGHWSLVIGQTADSGDASEMGALAPIERLVYIYILVWSRAYPSTEV